LEGTGVGHSMKYLNINIITILASVVLLIACTKSPLSKDEMIEYIMKEANGLNKIHENNGYKIRLTYRPNDMIVLQDIRSEEKITKEILEKAKKNYSNYAYFILELSYQDQEIINKGLSNPNVYGNMIEQLAFGMHDLASIVTSTKDTVPLADCIFIRMFGMTGSNTLMLVFNNEKINQSESFDLILKDNGFGYGYNKFNFLTKDINKVPELNFEFYK